MLLSGFVRLKNEQFIQLGRKKSAVTSIFSRLASSILLSCIRGTYDLNKTVAFLTQLVHELIWHALLDDK